MKFECAVCGKISTDRLSHYTISHKTQGADCSFIQNICYHNGKPVQKIYTHDEILAKRKEYFASDEYKELEKERRRELDRELDEIAQKYKDKTEYDNLPWLKKLFTKAPL